LLDGSPTSYEFREFLSLIGSSHLIRYAEQCLTTRFDGNGLALQDVVNELGRRLGFSVNAGRYRGAVGQIGYDGLWQFDGGQSIVVEVKTTDAYRMDMNVFATYRKGLIRNGNISERSSILIVVGREDTGDLEAQIRGSRHAWDIRLISVDGLIRLVRLKESIDDPKIAARIWILLTPQEYTKIDGIIEVVFPIAEEAQRDEELERSEEQPESGRESPHFIPVSFHEACVTRLEARLGISLIKHSKTTFVSPDNQVVLVCVVSREHTSANYWFAFHPHQKEFLSKTRTSYVCFGCGSERQVLAIPSAEFMSLLEGMNVTRGEDRFYWHVSIFKDGNRFVLHRKRGIDQCDLTRYLVPPESDSAHTR
jgi:hypothetical protein